MKLMEGDQITIEKLKETRRFFSPETTDAYRKSRELAVKQCYGLFGNYLSNVEPTYLDRNDPRDQPSKAEETSDLLTTSKEASSCQTN